MSEYIGPIRPSRPTRRAARRVSRGTSLVLALLLVLVMAAPIVVLSVKWFTAPCEDFRTKWYLRHGYAPSRCVIEVPR